MSKLINLTGMTFGAIKVIDRADESEYVGHKGAMWNTVCTSCGATGKARGSHLRGGLIRSCGCLRPRHVSESKTIHGAARRKRQTPEYVTWAAIIYRCHNPSSNAYRYYGARGITVCEEWRNSFESFLAHVGPKPSKDHSIDRINNHMGYEPGNVRWATADVQANNKSNNRLITFNGDTHTMKEWSTILAISYRAIFGRLRNGWSTERAFTEPVRGVRAP